MDQGKKIQDILSLQDELVHHCAVWNVKPWLELEMSTPQLKALFLICGEKQIRMRELARRLGGSFSNATVLVDRLVDRRVVLVRTTEDGRRLIERLVTSWRALSAPLLKKLAPEDLATVAKALRVILEATRDKRED